MLFNSIVHGMHLLIDEVLYQPFLLVFLTALPLKLCYRPLTEARASILSPKPFYPRTAVGQKTPVRLVIRAGNNGMAAKLAAVSTTVQGSDTTRVE